MKVLVANNMAPFVWGGAEELAKHLVDRINARGHEAELLRIPFRWEPAEDILAQMIAMRSFELPNVDRLIALKFPVYLLQHEHKSMWLLHQFRQAYDLYDAGYSSIQDDEAGQSLRETIARADTQSFAEARNVFTNAPTTSDRLWLYNEVPSEVLRPPLNDPELFTGGPSGGYIFAGGRVNGAKRQHLLVEALALASPKTRLVIAGPPESQADADLLHSTVERLGLAGRVTLDLRFLSRRELADYANHSSACAYIPFDEDSLGYVSMEAAEAGKAIITTTDSGGVLGLVQVGDNGWVAEPTPASLAEAMSAATQSPAKTRKMGQASRERWRGMNVTWDYTLDRLLS
jgi:glycosyltransferase involved in cell wall biosynthesis